MATQLSPKTTAQLLRRLLKAAFPAVRFSITTRTGSMVSAVSVGWVDGPTKQRVAAITAQFAAVTGSNVDDSRNYRPLSERIVTVDGQQYEIGCESVDLYRQTSFAFASRIGAALEKKYNDGWPVIVPSEWRAWRIVGTVDSQRDAETWTDLVMRAAEDRREVLPFGTH